MNLIVLSKDVFIIRGVILKIGVWMGALSWRVFTDFFTLN